MMGYKLIFLKCARRTQWIVWLLLSSVFCSCDNFLSEVPDNRVSLDDLDKMSQLLTNGYPVASVTFTDWMTDDFALTTNTNLRPSHTDMFYWDDPTSDPDEWDTPSFYWYESYKSIAHANEVLASIDNIEVNSELEKRKRDAVKSEAFLIRAYGHFMLVTLFAEQFDGNNQGNVAGIPYIYEPETEFIAQYERKSVKKVLSEIEDDIQDGLELLDDSFFNNSGKYHFNKNAALAFAAKYYAYKFDFIRTLQYSDELLGQNPSSFIRDMTGQEFRSAKSSIDGFPQLFNSPSLPSNLLLMRKLSLFQRNDFAFGVERNFYGGLFASHPFENGVTDERENPAFVKGGNTLFPVRYENLFERSSINSNVGSPYHIAIALSGEEVLFLRIESRIYTNDLDGALSDLQALVDKRYSGGDVTLTLVDLRAFYGVQDNPEILDGDILLNYYLLEKRKEFLARGMRWFDIKRYGMSVQHQNADGTINVLERDDLRKVLQIPLPAQEVAGLAANPR